MPYRNASFVIYYADGTRLVENRYDEYSWDNASKDNIIALGILTFEGKEEIINGSEEYYYGPFQRKLAITLPFTGIGQTTYGLQVGFVTNNNGHSRILEYRDNTFFRYEEQLNHQTLNFDLLNININRCGGVIEN